MLHIAGGIILAALFFNLLPVLLFGTGLLFRWLFITLAWLSAMFAGFYVLTHIPAFLEQLMLPDLRAWLVLAAIGAFFIIRKALRTPLALKASHRAVGLPHH